MHDFNLKSLLQSTGNDSMGDDTRGRQAIIGSVGREGFVELIALSLGVSTKAAN
jgi:hypothetical protein